MANVASTADEVASEVVTRAFVAQASSCRSVFTSHRCPLDFFSLGTMAAAKPGDGALPPKHARRHSTRTKRQAENCSPKRAPLRKMRKTTTSLVAPSTSSGIQKKKKGRALAGENERAASKDEGGEDPSRSSDSAGDTEASDCDDATSEDVVSGGEEGENGRKSRNPPRKPRDNKLRSHFIVRALDGGGVSVACKHCRNFDKPFLAKFNATKGRAHLVGHCDGIDVETKRSLHRSSQAMRHRAQRAALSDKIPADAVAELTGRIAALEERAARRDEEVRSLMRMLADATERIAELTGRAAALENRTVVPNGRGPACAEGMAVTSSGCIPFLATS